ncbi:MAG TPA: Gfo/Idh/MocA family oxidoreductase [Candidatus Binatia bacterium]|nr:Gfo/Idh/MocA family oxidoreductase [Candidatus Binatia bacterium]
MGREPERIAIVGSGGAAGQHVRALRALGRGRIVGIAGRSPERTGALASTDGAATYGDDGVARMLDEQRCDAAFVALPPHLSGPACDLLVERGVPFLVEKPLAADAETPVRLAAEIERRGLVVAVGYDWRGLDFLDELRAALAVHPPRLVVGRWLGDTPGPSWWRTAAQGGGQIVEQATHLFDLARALLGEASVVAARAVVAHRASAPETDVAGATAAVLAFERGVVGSFVASCLLASSTVELELASDGLLATIRHGGTWPDVGWSLTLEDSAGRRVLEPRRNPWEVQAEVFLDAVAADDPTRPLSTYADALRTDRLTRAVVAAAGVA